MALLKLLIGLDGSGGREEQADQSQTEQQADAEKLDIDVHACLFSSPVHEKRGSHLLTWRVHFQ